MPNCNWAYTVFILYGHFTFTVIVNIQHKQHIQANIHSISEHNDAGFCMMCRLPPQKANGALSEIVYIISQCLPVMFMETAWLLAYGLRSKQSSKAEPKGAQAKLWDSQRY